MKTVATNKKLVAFLYTVLHYEIVPGRIEKIVTDIEKHDVETYILSNEYIANYAKEVADRLLY